ncbi:MAG: hypothetical protein JNK37_13505 [Verrucomicrobiales bacterium]|nr:hypothetical protein [Verrucomicrobiales bacterium]
MNTTLRNFGDIPLGQGFNSISGIIRGNPFRSAAVAPPNSTAFRTEFSLKWIESSYELVTSLGLSASASWGGGSAGLDFAESNKVNRFSSFILVSVRVIGPSEVLAENSLSEGSEQLIREGSEAFFRQYGDSYVWRRRTGGEFFALLSMETVSESERRDIKAKVDASGGVFSAAAEFRSSFQEVTSSKNLRFSMIKNGGSPELPSASADSVLEQALHFTQEIAGTADEPGRAAILELDLLDYETLGADISKLRAIHLEIEGLAKAKWRLWDHVNDIEVLERFEAVRPGIIGYTNRELVDWKTRIESAIESIGHVRNRIIVDPLSADVGEIRVTASASLAAIPVALGNLQVVLEERIFESSVLLEGNADYRRTQGDSEMDTRPGRQTGVTVSVKVDVDSTIAPQFILLEVRSRHREESHSNHTTFEAVKHLRFPMEIPTNAIFGGFLDSKWNHSSRIGGRHHNWVALPPSGIVLEASVKFDSEGSNDRDDQGCRLALRLPYRLTIFRSIEG